MFSTNLKLTLRSLLKNKVFSFINILGLTVGLSVAIIIGLWVNNEMSFNHSFSNHDRVYRVIQHVKLGNGEITSMWALPQPLYHHLKENVKGVKQTVIQDWGQGHALKVGAQRISRGGYHASPEYFKMLEVPFLSGTAENALVETNSIVLTKKTAETLFGQVDPMGKTVRFDNMIDLKVTGVVERQPDNTSFDYAFILPFKVYQQTNSWVGNSITDWENFSFQVLLELEEGTQKEEVIAQIKDLIKENQENSTAEVDLYAMDDWHLRGEFKEGKLSGGFIRYVRMFGIVGIIVLLIAIINFMNLSTARSEKRAKEVGVRKTLGARRGQLIGQFLSEAMLLAFIAALLSIMTVDFALPYFNDVANRDLSIPFDEPMFWSLLLSVSVLTGLLAGSYPAFFLSAFKPISTLKNFSGSPQDRSNWARKVLVVGQFSASIILLIATVVVWQQINYLAERETGFDSNRLLMVTHEGVDLYNNQTAVDQALNQSGIVENFTRSSFAITEVYNYTNINWNGKEPNSTVNFPMVSTGYNYTKTLGIELAQGRDFSPEFASDSSAVLVNEAAVKAMSFENPIGEKIEIWGADRTIVGVIKDVLMLNPTEPIRPTIIQFNPYWIGNMMIRLSPNVATKDALATLEDIFNKYNPNYPFDYRFADETHAEKLSRMEMVGRLSTLFGLLAIFISCLGLFGLATHMAERRTKELGVRKVLGASVMNLWALLSKDFIALIFVSCLVATPIAIYLMNNWLADYAYRIDLQWWVFVLAAVVSILIALATISFQSIRAALINPVESLRDE